DRSGGGTGRGEAGRRQQRRWEREGGGLGGSCWTRPVAPHHRDRSRRFPRWAGNGDRELRCADRRPDGSMAISLGCATLGAGHHAPRGGWPMIPTAHVLKRERGSVSLVAAALLLVTVVLALLS